MSLLDQNAARRKTPERERDLAFEESYLDFTERLCTALAETGRTQADLARSLAKPPSFINKILRRKTNPGLRSLTDVAFAAGVEVRFVLAPLRTHGGRDVVLSNASDFGYRRAADALLRPDETAALRAEVAALKAALAAARAAAFKEAAKAVDAEAAEYAEGAHEDPSVTLYVNVLRETEKKIRALAAKENT